MAEKITVKRSLELRSGEVQEIIGQPPHWLIRWGMTIFFILLLLVLGLSWVIRYPDTVRANLTLTSVNAPVPVNIRIDGKVIRLLVKDNDAVSKGQVLGFMESTADPEQVLHLSGMVDSLLQVLNNNRTELIPAFFSEHYNRLGEMQLDFQIFSRSVLKFRSYLASGKRKLLNDLQSEQMVTFLQATSTFRSQLEEWKYRYVLTAPISGNINFNSFLQENQSVHKGLELFYIMPVNPEYIGLMYVSQFNLSKIHRGQDVIIKFARYSFEEYGSVPGKIADISNMPKGADYLVKVTFDNGLRTDFGKELEYREGMAATGEIITADKRLIEKFVYNSRKMTSGR
jgi:HlyD family secretion protein